MTDKCRFEGLCPDCLSGRYRGDPVECVMCGSTNSDRKTLGKICVRECDICLRIRLSEEAKQP